MALTPDEKASRRAAALARLYETKKRIESHGKGPAGGAAPPLSSPNATWSGGSAGLRPVAVSSGPSVRIDPLPPSVPRKRHLGGSEGAANERTKPLVNEGPVPAESAGQQARTQVSSKNRDASQKSGLLSRPFIEYDLSTMKDTKGGFLVNEEVQENQKWLETLPQQTPLYPLDDPRAPSCFECGTKEIDFRLARVFGTHVCRECRRATPDKYSMLTKTECKADYLLTEPELRDKDLLPHLERPNPYKNTYSNMMLFMRYQVEEYAITKWGSLEAMDAEFERRQENKATRKRAKFESKLRELRNKTRAQTITGTGRERHRHEWGNVRLQDDGTSRRYCECGMSIEEFSI